MIDETEKRRALGAPVGAADVAFDGEAESSIAFGRQLDQLAGYRGAVEEADRVDCLRGGG